MKSKALDRWKLVGFSSWTTVSAAVVVTFLLSGLSAFAQSDSAPPSSQSGDTPPPAAAPPSAKPADSGGLASGGAGAPVDSGSYKIGASDVLFIRVWGEPEFTGPVAVHQDGKFTLPLVGDLEAGGKTPIEVQAIVATALKKMVVKPLVTITVQDVGSKRYYLDGQIAHAGEYSLVTPVTVFEAISRAGGPTEFANTRKIYVLRGSQRLKFNYKEVLHGKNLQQNIKLQPGDHVVLP